MNDSHLRFAGWFTLDVRLLAAVVVFSAAVAVFALALRDKGKPWDQQVVRFFAVFALCLTATWLLTNLFAANPALRLETFMPVP